MRNSSDELRGWQVLALRAAGGTATLRRRIHSLGGRLHCVAPWRIQPIEQGVALKAAMKAPLWVVTSPNAARCVAACVDLRDFRGAAVAVGHGTRLSLESNGLQRVLVPAYDRFNSEGVLEMPVLRAPERVVLLTGEGGRGLIARELAARGTSVERIDVYRRLARNWTPAALQRIRGLSVPRVLLLSSVEALSSNPTLHPTLRGFEVVVASDRVGEAAAATGLRVVAVARSAMPQAMVEALCLHAKSRPIR